MHSFPKVTGKTTKAVIWIIVITFVVTIGWKLYNRFFPGLAQPSPGEKAVADAINSMHIDESHLSITVPEAKSIAEQFESELNSTFYIDTDKLFSLLTPLNLADLQEVIKTFGIRPWKKHVWSSVENLPIYSFFNTAIQDHYNATDEIARFQTQWSKAGF